MYRNDDGAFTDITKESALAARLSVTGWGLRISDINIDGYPDIYVGNDFHEKTITRISIKKRWIV